MKRENKYFFKRKKWISLLQETLKKLEKSRKKSSKILKLSYQRGYHKYLPYDYA